MESDVGMPSENVDAWEASNGYEYKCLNYAAMPDVFSI